MWPIAGFAAVRMSRARDNSRSQFLRKLAPVCALSQPPHHVDLSPRCSCPASERAASTVAGARPGRAPPAAGRGVPSAKRGGRCRGHQPTGWQKLAGAAVDKRALEMLFAELDNASRALLLSQSGEGASCVLTTVPSCPEFDVPNDEYRVVLLRSVRLPLPLAPAALLLPRAFGRSRRPPLGLRAGGCPRT